MKNLIRLTFVFLCLGSTLKAQTNEFYVTEEAHTNAFFVAATEQIQHARQAKDSRPAKNDPEGNWGQVTEGFQLSIRLSKLTFTNGEPIFASILLRNVSNKPLAYYVFYPKDKEMTFLVFKKEEQGQYQIQGKDETTTNMNFLGKLHHINNGSRSMPILPIGVQRRFVVNLTDWFDFVTNKEYTIRVSRQVLKEDGSGETNVISGYAAFGIKE